MRYKVLGRTGVQVSVLSFGAMTFGSYQGAMSSIGGLEEKEAREMVAACLDRGVNFFDTADGYSGGESERMLGRALGKRRGDVVVSTKVGFPTGKGPNERGLSRFHVTAGLNASLERLGTDHIDLYFLHVRDPLTPLEETMSVLDDLVRAGKIRYAGISNYPAWELATSYAVSEHRGLPRFECLQAYYSLISRDVEREIVPLLAARGASLQVWSPLAGGLLTGKYGKGDVKVDDSRRSGFDFIPYDADRLGRLIDAMQVVSEAHRCSMAQVALAWLVARPVVASVCIGAKRMSQLEDNLAAADLELTAGEVALLDRASALPPEYPGWFLERVGARS